jgi:hypothetical protein
MGPPVRQCDGTGFGVCVGVGVVMIAECAVCGQGAGGRWVSVTLGCRGALRSRCPDSAGVTGPCPAMWSGGLTSPREGKGFPLSFLRSFPRRFTVSGQGSKSRRIPAVNGAARARSRDCSAPLTAGREPSRAVFCDGRAVSSAVAVRTSLRGGCATGRAAAPSCRGVPEASWRWSSRSTSLVSHSDGFVARPS